MVKILYGRQLASEILAEVKEKVAKMATKPTLAVILVGNNSASEIFVKVKQKKAREVGINFKLFQLSEKIRTQDIINLIKKNNLDPKVTAQIVQLPLPKQIDQEKVFQTIKPAKDADGLGSGQTATAEAIMRLLKYYQIQYLDKKVVIIGQGILVGRPMAKLLAKAGAKIETIDNKTPNPQEISRKADILITGVGKPGFIGSDWIGDQVVVIDAGSPKGDVSKEAAFKSKAITPVPGGVGPVTVAVLLERISKIV